MTVLVDCDIRNALHEQMSMREGFSSICDTCDQQQWTWAVSEGLRAHKPEVVCSTLSSILRTRAVHYLWPCLKGLVCAGRYDMAAHLMTDLQTRTVLSGSSSFKRLVVTFVARYARLSPEVFFLLDERDLLFLFLRHATPENRYSAGSVELMKRKPRDIHEGYILDCIAGLLTSHKQAYCEALPWILRYGTLCQTAAPLRRLIDVLRALDEAEQKGFAEYLHGVFVHNSDLGTWRDLVSDERCLILSDTEVVVRPCDVRTLEVSTFVDDKRDAAKRLLKIRRDIDAFRATLEEIGKDADYYKLEAVEQQLFGYFEADRFHFICSEARGCGEKGEECFFSYPPDRLIPAFPSFICLLMACWQGTDSQYTSHCNNLDWNQWEIFKEFYPTAREWWSVKN